MQRSFNVWKLPWKVFIGLFLIATAIGYLNSEWSNELRERAISPLEFKLRKSLSRGQEYSEKLKVLVFGDKAKREFGVQELIPIRQWADFISQVAARQPKAIIFDKMFTFSLGTQEDIEYFNSTLAGLKTKVIAAGTFNDSAISEGVFDSQMLTSWSVESPDSIPKGRLSRFIGPAPHLRKSFFRIGGVQLSNAAAVYPAWIDLESEKMLPHLSLSYFENAIVQNDHVTLDDTTLFLDRYGRIPINFIDRGLAYTRFLPINSIFRLGWKSPVLTKINKNDVVLVLPSMYTGSTDFKNSPIGRISGGLYYASLINTVLLNNPIKPLFNGIFSNIILFIIIAYFVWLLSSKLSFTRSVLAITFLSIVIVVLGLVTFAYWNIQSDWHTYSFFAALWGSGLLTMRAAQEERNAQFAEVLLEGIVSKDVLKRIKHRPEIWNLRPIEQSMTVMFIDIEGFSLRTKDLFPVDMFSVLHAQINEISAIVHEHGGIVDRVLGDGMLCFFGFSFDDHKSEVQFDHALRALKCALAVQRSAIQLTIQSSPSAMSAGSVLPLRIGLCTGETFIGNMGTDRRLDFTVIGHTVNMAKRYEDACETFRVFMSETTYRELENRNQLHEFFDVMFVQRYMAMKHQLELVLGWECDPFFSNNDGYRAALKKIKPESKDNLQLTKLKPQHTLKIKLNQSSSGVLTWFDMDRYIVETDSYFCRKVNLVAELISDVEDINIQLAVANLKILHFQVNQGQALGQNVYRHELLLLNITPEKRKVLLTLLTEGD